MGDLGGRHRNWGWIDEGPTATVEERQDILRARARGLVRNAAYGWAVVEAIVQRSVGPHGILARPMDTTATRQKRLANLWAAWGDDPAQVDFDGRLTFAAMQDVVMRTVVASGSCLVRLYVSPDNPDNPLQLRVMEPDYLACEYDGVRGGNEVRQGIETDPYGRVLAYWIHKRHPKDRSILGLDVLDADRIDRREILHIYRDDRAGQKIGVSWLHPVGATVRDRALWSSASLAAQRMAACLGVMVTDPSGEADDEEIDEAMRLSPGMVAWLPPHRDVKTLTPPTTQDSPEYDRSLLREIAAGVGISYESLTGDLSETNFSSAKLGQIKFQTNVNSWQQKMLIPQLLNPIWRRWVELIRESRRGRSPIRVQWTVPRREIIDPEKEWKAILLAVRAGFVSLGDAIRQQTGQQPELVLEEIAEVNKLLDELDLTLDSDPRKSNAGNQSGGNANPPAGPGGTGETPEGGNGTSEGGAGPASGGSADT